MYPWFASFSNYAPRLNIDVHPTTKVATVTQTANAVSLFGGGPVIAQNLSSISQ